MAYTIPLTASERMRLSSRPPIIKEIPDLEDYEVENILKMYCRRMSDLRKDSRFKYILLFKNYGPSAGASLEHPHTQLIALPMIPKNVQEELDGAFHYFEYRERCIFCDIIRQEIQEKERIIFENRHFVAFCPYVSKFAFEVWVTPKKHQDAFCLMNPEQIQELAKILKSTLARINEVLYQPAYNFYYPYRAFKCGASGGFSLAH